MSDTADSTLSALKALIAAFQTGATPVAVKTSTAEAASLPPKFPGPDDKKGKTSADNSTQQKTEYNERGRLPASRTQTEGNYARQYLEGYVKGSEHPSDKKTQPGCPASLHISLFFDGTGCNEEDGDEVYGSRNPPLTNIGRLYHAANWLDKAENDGYFCYYFPGCGARFPEIGEEHYSLDGELFANGGEDRINQALLKTYSSICYAVKKERIEDSELTRYRNSMATVWPFSRLTQKFNRKSALDKFCDDHLEAVVNQWPRQPTRLYIQRSQRRIAKIKLFVYGYCRGAATARAFARGLESLLDDARMPLDATNMLPAGTVVPPGPTLLGIPISIEFMGLLDTVSAVGVPHILPSATGHLGWAANSLRLPTTKGFLKSCYHFVAGHEQHGDLPLDSIRGPDGKYPAGAVEVVYPGMHADVGGDCKPAELGKVQTDAASLLSKIVLHDMYAAAFDAGAPLSVPPEVLPGGAKEKTYRMMSVYVLEQFKISEQAIALFNACSRRRRPRKAKGREKCRLSIRIGWTARRGAMTLPIPVSWRCWILFPPRKPAGKNDY
ncbi:T6SS phospholipase effector Tle1-like catalytic domain-containing protein [Klebsiella aerogenes]